MDSTLYNPFIAFTFDKQTCFLTGEKLSSTSDYLHVFPEWLMDQFDLKNQPFKMLDENRINYDKLHLPASKAVISKFSELDSEISEAMNKGYDAVANVSQISLFQWVAKILYGVVFNEIQSGIRQSVLSGEEMNFAQALVHKFRNLHRMLQSVTLSMEFEHKNPFAILVLPVDNPDQTFSYRDEINTLIFSLRMKDFAIIATLQDNGTNAIYHEDVLHKVKDKKLHPIQFEEICARYFYTAYLFNRLPEYTYLETPAKIFIEPMPLNDFTLKPIFDAWQTKTYGQVLENFWKPWGFTLFEIIKDPEHPMTFIEDEKGQFRESIDVKYIE